VEKIVADRKKNGTRQYRVQWVGWDPKFNTWEPEENLQNCIKLLNKYKNLKEKGSPRRVEVKEKSVSSDIAVNKRSPKNNAKQAEKVYRKFISPIKFNFNFKSP
ncbi:unnamed protein product, partial [Meganyctiphanes norvegica]